MISSDCPPVLGDGGQRVVVPMTEAIRLAEEKFGQLYGRPCVLSPRPPDERRLHRNEIERASYYRNQEKRQAYARNRYHQKKKAGACSS